MNIGRTNPCLIFAKPLFVIFFHPYVSVSKAARVQISCIDSHKNITFVFQQNFDKVFGFVMEVIPKLKCFLNFSQKFLYFSNIIKAVQVSKNLFFLYLIFYSYKLLTPSKEASFSMNFFLFFIKRSSYFYQTF